jgi:hypothetical protein
VELHIRICLPLRLWQAARAPRQLTAATAIFSDAMIPTTRYASDG